MNSYYETPDYLNIVNNKKCPYCNSVLVSNSSVENVVENAYGKDHRYCYKHKYRLKVMYSNKTETCEWILIRVFMAEEVSVEIDKRIGNFLRITSYPDNIFEQIPIFNIFACPLSELQNKIKGYLIFT
jgi:hypothetical protein